MSPLHPAALPQITPSQIAPSLEAPETPLQASSGRPASLHGSDSAAILRRSSSPESTMRRILYEKKEIEGEPTRRPRIKSPSSNVVFECLAKNARKGEIEYLAKMHEVWLAESPTYATSIAKATAGGKSIRVQINDEYDAGGRTDLDDNGECLIEINPAGYDVDSSEPLDDEERKAVACWRMLFELQNAATADDFVAISRRAESGGFTRQPVPEHLSAMVEKVMRHEDDRPAALFAIAIEYQEYKNTQTILRIAEELDKKGIGGISADQREAFQWESFQEYLEVQIENNHTQPYLAMYDELTADLHAKTNG